MATNKIKNIVITPYILGILIFVGISLHSLGETGNDYDTEQDYCACEELEGERYELTDAELAILLNETTDDQFNIPNEQAMNTRELSTDYESLSKQSRFRDTD